MIRANLVKLQTTTVFITFYFFLLLFYNFFFNYCIYFIIILLSITEKKNIKMLFVIFAFISVICTKKASILVFPFCVEGILIYVEH